MTLNKRKLTPRREKLNGKWHHYSGGLANRAEGPGDMWCAWVQGFIGDSPPRGRPAGVPLLMV